MKARFLPKMYVETPVVRVLALSRPLGPMRGYAREAARLRLILSCPEPRQRYFVRFEDGRIYRGLASLHRTLTARKANTMSRMQRRFVRGGV